MPTITGSNGNDTLLGTGSSDIFYPLLGIDTVDGLGDSDTLVVDYSLAPYDPYAGAGVPGDLISTVSSNGGSFSGRITGGSAAVDFSNVEHLQVILNFWQDRFVINAAALAFGATIQVDGGQGIDTLQIDLSSFASINVQADSSDFTASFGRIINFERFAMNLTEGADNVTTGGGSDTLTGNGGNDVLNGGGGNDVLSGGAGANILNGGDGDDQLFSVGIDSVNGGAGFDRWSGNYGWLTTDFSITSNQVTGTATLSVGTTLTGIEWIESLVTGSGNDSFVVVSDLAAISIDAGAGLDRLTLSGNGFSGDLRADGAGAFRGSLGYNRFTGIELLNFTSLDFADVISVDAAPLLAGATLRLDAAGGSDTLILDLIAFASISFVVAADGTLTSNVPATLLNFENFQLSASNLADSLITGAGNDVVHGNGGDDVISTGGGNDLLDGGAGADTMTGGTGNDIYIVTDANDTIVENSGEGSDEVRTSIAGFSMATLTALEDLTGTSDAGQTLIGNALANRITAGNGNDTLVGGGGEDLLQGKGGNDTYVIEGGLVSVLELDGAGSDRVLTTNDYALTYLSEIEALAVFDAASTNRVELTGNAYNQVMVGNAGDNYLTGGWGADDLDGKGGADIFHYATRLDSTTAAPDRIRAFQTGIDKIDLGGVVPAGVSWVQHTDASDNSIYQLVSVFFNGGGGMTLRVDGALAMSDFLLTLHRTLAGTSASGDWLSGGDGNDSLDGLAGADTMVGRAGNDAYYVDDIGDLIAEAADQGTDTAYVTISYALRAGISIERLEARDPGAATPLTLTGNELAQSISGNAGANVLIGGGGDDRLSGGGGSDRLEGGSGADIFAFAAATDSRTWAMRSDGHKQLSDVIVDFTQGSDRIDLSAIDAIAGFQANDAFTFIGSGAFTGQAGQLRFETAGGSTSVFADLNGDGGADMQIVLLAPVMLTAADFIL